MLILSNEFEKIMMKTTYTHLTLVKMEREHSYIAKDIHAMILSDILNNFNKIFVCVFPTLLGSSQTCIH